MKKVDEIKFVLRIPKSLHGKIRRNAKSNNTSMNKEIANILGNAVSGDGVQSTLDTLVERLEKKKVI